MEEVKCRLCGEKISYNSNDVGALGDHLLNRHPGAEITHFSFDDDGGTGVRPGLQKNGGKRGERSDLKIRRRLFKTTVETWKPGPSQIACPSCGESVQPLVRKQRNKVARTSLGALCLLGCWPLCFLPLFMCSSNKMNLYCPKCGEFLGSYDRKKEKLQPPDQKGPPVKVPNICDYQ